MNYASYNGKLLRRIPDAILQNRVAGCYLIEGAEGTGKLSAARFFAQALCCTAPEKDASPCGQCHSCRQIKEGGHIDVLELYPEEKGKNVTVEQVRNLLKNCYVSPVESEWRIFILPNCEKLNKAAQNALLKSIEEPGEKTVFFLLTEDKTKVLPTVRSRAVIYRTEEMAPDAIRSLLCQKGISEPVAAACSLMAQGSPGRALSLAYDEETLKMREKVISYFKAILDGAGFARLCLILPPQTTARKDFALFLPMMKLALTDLILHRSTPRTKTEFFTDLSLLKDLSQIVFLPNAIRLLDLTDRLILANDTYVNLFSALSQYHLNAKILTRETQ